MLISACGLLDSRGRKEIGSLVSSMSHEVIHTLTDASRNSLAY